MGSLIMINDTLQITTEQGFPAELDLAKHEAKPFTLEDFKNQVFEFIDKPGTRVFQKPPFRNFLAQNTGDSWVYWGQIEIIKLTLDYVNDSTSGQFRITKIYSPEDMVNTNHILDAAKFSEQKH